MMRRHNYLRKDSGAAFENRLLAALPGAEYEHLAPHLELVKLAPGKIIYDAGEHVRYAYFPKRGMVSLLSVTEAGRTIEVGVIGNEGVTGMPLVLRGDAAQHRVMVQVAVSALRIGGRVLREEFDRGGHLQDLLLYYTNTLINQITQAAACSRFHTVEERLCRWLLISRDRVQGDTLHITQEFISHMLGVPRSSITDVAGTLQSKQIIRYSRGKIDLLDRAGLEAASCECYGVFQEEFRNFLVA